MTDSSRVRVSIIGVVVVALFAALLGRLWFLQVGSNESYVAQAAENGQRELQTEAPRGRILDRNGRVLVENRVSWAVTVDRDLDDDTEAEVLGRLATLLGAPNTPASLAEQVDDPGQTVLRPAVVALDVSERVRLAVKERQEDYPGVDVTKVSYRTYPYGRLASHLLGYTGEISAEELAARTDAGYQPADTIGKGGLERAYEADLRGEPRKELFEVDPAGRVVGEPQEVSPGRIGHDVRLTLDVDFQGLAEASLREGMAQARGQKNVDVKDRVEYYKAPAGAVVVLDARDGSVLAMASAPDYDPSEFVAGISKARFAELTEDPAQHQPLVNRALQGTYAPGSTFKPITALAALEKGYRTPFQTIYDAGKVEIGNREFRNAGGNSYGMVDLPRSLTVSSDVYYYLIGREMWQSWRAGDAGRGDGIQEQARRFGFGAPTGIPLDEAAGRVPDAKWKQEFANALYENDPEARRENSIWLPGDNVNLAVGQGDLLVTPLQLANAYAALANGGTLWQPRLASAVLDADGREVRTIASTERAKAPIRPEHRAPVLAGLTNAVSSGEGTANAAFGAFPLDQVPVAGKTGTAQVGTPQNRKGDTSWFVGVYPATAPQYVVLAVVEEGGFGARVAAPIVRRVIEGLNGLPISPVQVVAGQD